MRSILTTILLLASATTNAATVTIDFDDLPNGGTPDGGGYIDVTTQDYYFNSQGGVGESGAPGNKVIAGLSTGGLYEAPEIYFARGDGQAFSLLAADIDGVVSGYVASSDNGSFNDSTGPGLNELGTGAWLNVNSVYLIGLAGTGSFTILALDNVVVGAAVPVPAAVWLFGSALAGLGWVRRRKTAGPNPTGVY
jgi:hypothetical protein